MYICYVKHQKSGKRYLFDCTHIYNKVYRGAKVLCENKSIGWVVSEVKHITKLELDNIVQHSKATIPLKKIIYVLNTIDLSHINIPPSFAATVPNPYKVYKCVDYFKKTGRLDCEIIIDKDNVLVDGYIRYLVAKMFNIKKVRYKRQND